MSNKSSDSGTCTNPVTPVCLREAFAAVVQQRDFTNKIRWWLNSLHAAERWFQFELAYALDCAYRDNFIAACEYDDYTDIAVYKNPPKILPLWDKGNKPVAKIELKWIGNWWIKKDQASGILEDIKKVDGYSQPSIALVICTVFSTTSGDPSYAAVLDQIKQCETATFADVRERLSGFEVNLRLIADAKAPMLQDEPSTRLEYYLLGHPNPAAAPLFQGCKSISEI